jgi:hypothetical protein
LGRGLWVWRGWDVPSVFRIKAVLRGVIGKLLSHAEGHVHPETHCFEAASVGRQLGGGWDVGWGVSVGVCRLLCVVGLFAWEVRQRLAVGRAPLPKLESPNLNPSPPPIKMLRSQRWSAWTIMDSPTGGGGRGGRGGGGAPRAAIVGARGEGARGVGRKGGWLARRGRETRRRGGPGTGLSRGFCGFQHLPGVLRAPRAAPLSPPYPRR